MASNDFELSAVISADSSQFTSAMSGLVATIQEASQSLRTQLVGSSEQAGEAIGGLKQKASEASEGFTASFGEMRESVMHVIEVLGVLEGINIAREQVAQTLEWGETITKMGIETGTSTAFVQQLGFAAQVTGSDMGRLTMAAGQLTRQYAEIQAGGGSPQLLASLKNAGINPSQLSSMQSGIEAVAGAVQHFGIASGQARDLVLQLFGRQGLDYLPMLANFTELSEKANQLGVVLSGSLVGRLDEAEESLNTLGAVIDADKERLGAALAPAIEVAANMLTQLAASVGKLEQGQGMEQFSRNITNGMFNVADGIVTAEGKLIEFGETFESVAGKIISLGHDIAEPFELLSSVIGGAATQIKSIATTGSFDYGAAGSQGFDNSPGASSTDAFLAKQRAYIEQMREQTNASWNAPDIADTAAGGGQSIPATGSSKAADEAKKAQQEALQSYQQQLEAYTEEQAIEVSVATNTAQAKVQAATNVYEKAVSLIGQTGAVTAQGYQKEVDAALRAGVEELNARREMLNQTKALAAQQISASAQEQLQQLAVQKAGLAEELAAHQITKAQELAAEQNLVSQTLAIELNKDSQLESNYAGDAQKFQEYQQQKVEAYFKAQQEMIENQTQSLQQQEQATQQAGTKMAADINQGLTLMEKYFESAGKQQQSVMREAFQGILKDFQDMIEKMIEKWLESTTLFKIFTGGEAIGQEPDGASGTGGGLIGGIGSVLSGAVGGPGGTGYSLMGGAIGGNPALAGLGPQSFAPGQDLNASMFTQPLSQAFEGATGTISNVFRTAFTTAGSALTDIFHTAMSGLGSLFGGGGAAGGGNQIPTQQLAQSTLQTGIMQTSQTHLQNISSNSLVANTILELIELYTAMSALMPSIFGTKAESGAFVGPGFGSPVGDGRGGMIGVLHPGELVLPASHVDPHTRMPNARALNMPPMSAGAERMLSGGGESGDVHHHVNISFGDTHALDGDGMDEVLQKHGGKIAGAVMDHLGRMGGRENYR